MSNYEIETRDRELNQVANVAATAAAELVKTAAQAAANVANTAASAAHILAESTRIDLGYIKSDIAEIKQRLDNKYVSVEVFEPVKRVVYGIVTLMLVAVVGGILALIIKK